MPNIYDVFRTTTRGDITTTIKSKAIPDILTDAISQYSDAAAKADLFNKYFQYVLIRIFLLPTSTLKTREPKTKKLNILNLIIYGFKIYHLG